MARGNSGCARRKSATRSMLRGSMSGSSPWTFRTISTGRSRTAAKTRSVPDGRAGSVRTARPPAASTARGDPRVVRRDEDEVDPFGLLRPLQDADDHRNAGDGVERLARKALGAESGRDDGRNAGHVRY